VLDLAAAMIAGGALLFSGDSSTMEARRARVGIPQTRDLISI